MAYNADKAKKARLRLMVGDGAVDSSRKKSVEENDNNNYNIIENELQEVIEKKFTKKRRRAMDAARVMDGIARDMKGRLVYLDTDVSTTTGRVYSSQYNGELVTETRLFHNYRRECDKPEEGAEGVKHYKWWEESAFKMELCGSRLVFGVQPDRWKLQHANFCKNKFCPYCAWRRSLKVYGQMSKVMDYLTESPETKDLRYIFLTLTQRNCTADELPDVVGKMILAWRAIVRGCVLPEERESRKYSWLTEYVIKGTFRALEITINQESNTYHPHFHAVVAVPGNYFNKNNPWYLNHGDWMTLWRVAMALDYDPSVRIEAIKPDPERGYGKAVAEVSKYPVKDSDFVAPDIPFDKSKEYLYNLAVGLFKRRLLSWSGVFFRARRTLNLADPETDDDLANDEVTELRDDVRTLIRVYSWRSGVTGGYQRDERAEEKEARRVIDSGRGIDISADDFDDSD